MRNDFLNNMNTNSFLFHLLGLPLIFLLLCLVLLSPGVGKAAAPVKGSKTRITSEKMTYDANKNQVAFEGKVHVAHTTLEIWSDVLTVILDDSGKKSASSSQKTLGVGGGKVDRIIAEKNVRIQQDNKSGTCGKATYYVNAGKIVMEHSPVIVDGDNRIKGRVINYFTESGRSEVLGNVDVQFTTDDNKLPVLPGLDAGQSGTAGSTTEEKVQQ